MILKEVFVAQYFLDSELISVMLLPRLNCVFFMDSLMRLKWNKDNHCNFLKQFLLEQMYVRLE